MSPPRVQHAPHQESSSRATRAPASAPPPRAASATVPAAPPYHRATPARLHASSLQEEEDMMKRWSVVDVDGAVSDGVGGHGDANGPSRRKQEPYTLQSPQRSNLQWRDERLSHQQSQRPAEQPSHTARSRFVVPQTQAFAAPLLPPRANVDDETVRATLLPAASTAAAANPSHCRCWFLKIPLHLRPPPPSSPPAHAPLQWAPTARSVQNAMRMRITRRRKCCSVR